MEKKKMNIVFSLERNLEIIAYYYWSHKPVFKGGDFYKIAEQKIGYRPAGLAVIDALGDYTPIQDSAFRSYHIIELGRSVCMEVAVYPSKQMKRVCFLPKKTTKYCF